MRAFQSTPPVKAATISNLKKLPNALFQSTPPVKAATYMCNKKSGNPAISIHAAREGGDGFGINASAIILYFNPRRP